MVGGQGLEQVDARVVGPRAVQPGEVVDTAGWRNRPVAQQELAIVAGRGVAEPGSIARNAAEAAAMARASALPGRARSARRGRRSGHRAACREGLAHNSRHATSQKKPPLARSSRRPVSIAKPRSARAASAGTARPCRCRWAKNQSTRAWPTSVGLAGPSQLPRRHDSGRSPQRSRCRRACARREQGNLE